MQSSGAWIFVLPTAHQHSDDSDSGIDAFSLISANPEPSDTSCLDLDAVCNMALPLDNDQPPSENLHPLRPAIVDWVEEQSLHDQTSDGATELQRARVENVPPLAGKQKQARARTSEYASRQEGHQQVKKVYDIPTLLKLRETQSAIPVMLRVKPEAIAGKSICDVASQTLLSWTDIVFQRTSSSIWELQRHVDYQHALAAFLTSPISLPATLKPTTTPSTLQRDQNT